MNYLLTNFIGLYIFPIFSAAIFYLPRLLHRRKPKSFLELFVCYAIFASCDLMLKYVLSKVLDMLGNYQSPETLPLMLLSAVVSPIIAVILGFLGRLFKNFIDLKFEVTEQDES